VPIFRSAKLYTTAYGFQHLKCWQESWGRWEAGSVHCVEAVFRETASTQCSSVHPCTPEDGHNGARNMLNHWFFNKS